MQALTVSVRKLVEFLLRSGDIDASSSVAAELDAMQLGSDVHRRLQSMAGESYQAEVSLARSFYFPQGQFVPAALTMDIAPSMIGDSDPTGWFLRVEGRADGVIDEPGRVTIDEIKGTYASVAELVEPRAVHVAQAKCYAYLYLRGIQAAAGDATLRRTEPVAVRMTYVGLDTGEVRRFLQTMWFQELEEWFLGLLRDYYRWLGPRQAHVRRRDEALSQLNFPFPWRPGQQELTERVGRALRAGERLCLQAPTGSGKTVASIWPALRCIGAGAGRRLVYLTAKTIARQAAVDCLQLLNRDGARVVAVVLTAHDKICPLRQGRRAATMRSSGHVTPCNPVECPYARGHFDRIGEATYELLSASEGGAVLDREVVLATAEKRHVCPYELQLELADWADAIVCDYNYVFSPSAALRCLGDDPEEAILLVDEAHNLVDRARDLYSAELSGRAFARAASALERESWASNPQAARELAAALKRVARWFGYGRRQLPVGAQQSRRELPPSGRTAAARDAQPACKVVRDFGKLPPMLEDVLPLMERYLSEASVAEQVRDPYVLTNELHLQVLGFCSALERAGEKRENYMLYQERIGGSGPDHTIADTRAKVFCADPSTDVGERLGAVRASVLFSATLIPMDYYRTLLAARDDDPTYRATSSFDPLRQRVLIGGDVSMRYSRRDQTQYQRVSAYVRLLLEAHPGNYLVFVPSYAVLEAVRMELAATSALPAGTRVLAQRGAMSERDREEFLSAFRAGHESACPELPSAAARASASRELAVPPTSLVGLCVLGGFFAESIDLRGDALVGVVVVGTGLPGMSTDRELVRKRFDEDEKDGFAYAYTYPGMAKVLQAAGRLIRSEDDAGVVLLLDDRFTSASYRLLFPREWGAPREVTQDTVAEELARFWSGLQSLAKL